MVLASRDTSSRAVFARLLHKNAIITSNFPLCSKGFSSKIHFYQVLIHISMTENPTKLVKLSSNPSILAATNKYNLSKSGEESSKASRNGHMTNIIVKFQTDNKQWMDALKNQQMHSMWTSYNLHKYGIFNGTSPIQFLHNFH